MNRTSTVIRTMATIVHTYRSATGLLRRPQVFLLPPPSRDGPRGQPAMGLRTAQRGVQTLGRKTLPASSLPPRPRTSPTSTRTSLAMRSAGQLSCLENAPVVAATASDRQSRGPIAQDIGPTVSLASEAASTASETLSETTGQNDEKTKTEEAASMAF